MGAAGRWLLAAAVGLCAAGCVRRTLEVTSDPSGAQLVVNGHPVGFTPTKLAFRYTGVYLIELHKSGYAPVAAGREVPSKFYELAGPDIVAEVLWPGVITDERKLHYQLEPEAPADREKLLAASQRAAAEAERLIPVLEVAPPPDPHARDRKYIPPVRVRPEPRREPGPDRPPRDDEPVAPDPKPPKIKTIPAPEDVPEIEKNRNP
jgi:hypothetical protein